MRCCVGDDVPGRGLQIKRRLRCIDVSRSVGRDDARGSSPPTSPSETENLFPTSEEETRQNQEPNPAQLEQREARASRSRQGTLLIFSENSLISPVFTASLLKKTAALLELPGRNKNTQRPDWIMKIKLKSALKNTPRSCSSSQHVIWRHTAQQPDAPPPVQRSSSQEMSAVINMKMLHFSDGPRAANKTFPRARTTEGKNKCSKAPTAEEVDALQVSLFFPPSSPSPLLKFLLFSLFLGGRLLKFV